MMMVFSIIGYTLLAICVIAVLLCIIIGFKLVAWFSFKGCKHCGHNMEYRGFKEDDNSGHYLFHCKHCGAWEQIPREEFIRSCDEDCNPNEQ